MFKHLKTKDLFVVSLLLCCLVSCQSPGVQPADSGAASVSAPAPAILTDTADLFAVPKGYTFHLDSSSLDRFIYNWYLFAFGFEYHRFQKELMDFPFPCMVRDSFQHTDTLLFPSLDSMFIWRKNHLAFFNRGQRDIRRVLYEGYPETTFDTMPFNHFDRIPETDSIVVTYIGPFAKADYYFRKTKGRWILVKSAHRLYGQRELNALPLNKFEDFLLRFRSDPAFQLEHIKFPLKSHSEEPDESQKTTYISLEDWKDWIRNLLENPLSHMTIYPNFAKKRTESLDMYVSVRDEGGGCGWDHFQKIKNRWVLTEQLNCSN